MKRREEIQIELETLEKKTEALKVELKSIANNEHAYNQKAFIMRVVDYYSLIFRGGHYGSSWAIRRHPTHNGTYIKLPMSIYDELVNIIDKEYIDDIKIETKYDELIVIEQAINVKMYSEMFYERYKGIAQ